MRLSLVPITETPAPPPITGVTTFETLHPQIGDFVAGTRRAFGSEGRGLHVNFSHCNCGHKVAIKNWSHLAQRVPVVIWRTSSTLSTTREASTSLDGIRILPGDLEKNLHLDFSPRAFVIDEDGRVVWRQTRPDLSPNAILHELVTKKLLPEEKTS